MSSGAMTDRRFIFFAVILIIMGTEFFSLRFMMNNNPNYGQELINAEVDNYIKIAGIETTERIHNAVSSLKDFIHNAVKGKERLFNMIMNTVGVPVIVGIVRAFILVYAIPLIIVGFILGFSEGRISQNKKIEQFKFQSTMVFHWTHRSAIFFFSCLLIAYLISPVPANPYFVLYGYGVLAYTLVYNSVSNLPFGKF